MADQTVLYFAYGSNLPRRRIEARLGPCDLVAVAHLAEHRLAFHKRGEDGSAKCNVFHTGDATDMVHGVVYRITHEQRRQLDVFEGIGYDPRVMELACAQGALRAFLYIAQAPFVDERLRPFPWYREFVLLGVREHAFPAAYRRSIEEIPTVADEDPQRAACNGAVLRREVGLKPDPQP